MLFKLLLLSLQGAKYLHIFFLIDKRIKVYAQHYVKWVLVRKRSMSACNELTDRKGVKATNRGIFGLFEKCNKNPKQKFL